MSAWIVSKNHIDRMLTAARFGYTYAEKWNHFGPFAFFDPKTNERRILTDETVNEIGQMLVDANVASVYYRYPTDRNDLPGPKVAYYDALPYRYERTSLNSLAEIAKAIACYEYQTCERDDWKGSSAQAFCRALRDELLGSVPGYAAAPWGFNR